MILNREWKENTEEKHSIDAARGWNYYDVDMLVKSGNGNFHYSGNLNVRLDADGNDYVYDITKIKRTVNQRLSTGEADTFAGKRLSSINTVAQKERAGNRNFRAVEEISEENRSDGQLKKEITTHDHGHPKQHPFGDNEEHVHDYKWSEEPEKRTGHQGI